MNKKGLITALTTIIAAVFIVLGFIYFSGSSQIESGLKAVPPGSLAGVSGVSPELLSALSSLQDLKLDDKFLRDKAFVSLNDYSKDLVDEPIGRENPFLPVSSESF